MAGPLFAGEGYTVPRRPAPRVGEHTDEVLAVLGYATAEIETMRRDGAVG
jgi:crotonobetainyl-CoA:carnitine CoA-transferase CaiB-like acyl-CoA transferase